MGGWNIFYALINFALLALSLYLLGKKLVLGIYRDYRENIRQGLESSERATSSAAELEARLEANGGEEQRRYQQRRSQALEAAEQLPPEAAEELESLRMAEEKRQAEFADRQRLLSRGRMGHELAAALADGTAGLFRTDADMRKTLDEDFLRRFAQLFPAVPPESGGERLDIKLSLSSAEQRPYEEKLLAIIDEKIPGREKSFKTVIDESLIAGMQLRLGGVLYDGSLRRQLELSEAAVVDAMKDSEPEKALYRALVDFKGGLQVLQFGKVVSMSDGICRASGLYGAMESELLFFKDGLCGIVMDLEADNVGIAMLGDYDNVREGDEVFRSGHVVQVPVGDDMLGRIVNALGEPVDNGPELVPAAYRSVEGPAPAVIDRQAVKVPMQTGIKAVDALMPIGRGQRELIIGDRQTGKSSIALDAIINQKGRGVVCIYVAIGQKESTVAGFVNKLDNCGARDYTIVVCAGASESAPMLYLAPYAGTAIGEYFMYKGRDVLIIYDDLSKHAVAYRELSLLLHRPPGREAYPGDVFYLHSRLLERSARLSEALGGGSMTALPIIETQAGDISAYIPTNVISITDGQIFLESELFNANVRPAVNVGLSVSRVGGNAQLGAMKQAAGQLKLNLAQYRELEAFTEFSSELDEATKFVLHRGERSTELLKQPCYEPMDVCDQVVTVFAANEGFADRVELKDISRFEKELHAHVVAEYPQLRQEILSGNKLPKESIERLRETVRRFSESWS